MDAEQRFQLLESEMNLIKGEVKQVLVDLREFVMGERHPFPNLARPGQPANSRNGKPASVPAERWVSAPVEFRVPWHQSPKMPASSMSLFKMNWGLASPSQAGALSRLSCKAKRPLPL